MIGINVKADLREVERMASRMQREIVPTAAARALNRTIDKVKTTAVREIAAYTKIKQKDIRVKLPINGASKYQLIVRLEALRLSPNFAYFNATQNKRGVAASAWGKRKTYAHAFFIRGKVVARIGKERKGKLKRLFGPSLPNVFMRQQMIDRFNQVAEQTWNTEFQRQITLLL